MFYAKYYGVRTSFTHSLRCERFKTVQEPTPLIYAYKLARFIVRAEEEEFS